MEEFGITYNMMFPWQQRSPSLATTQVPVAAPEMRRDGTKWRPTANQPNLAGYIQTPPIHERLFTNRCALSAHAQGVVGKRADNAVRIHVFLGAASSPFLPILCA